MRFEEAQQKMREGEWLTRRVWGSAGMRPAVTGAPRLAWEMANTARGPRPEELGYAVLEKADFAADDWETVRVLRKDTLRIWRDLKE